MDLIEWVIWLVYLTLMVLILYLFRSSKQESYYKFLIPAFSIKVVGGLAFALIYIYYYGFGDTFLYFEGSKVLSDLMVTSPSDYFRLLASGEGANIPADLVRVSSTISYSRTYEEWVMVKLLSPITLLSFKSYLVLTLFMSTISFVGSWKLLRVFLDIIPSKPKLAFIATFLIPSVIFWGGGVMKDTFTLFAINYLIYCLYFTLFKRQFKFKLIVICLLCFALILGLKAYVALAFVPAVLLGVYALFLSRITSKFLTRITGPVLFALLLIGSYYSLSLVSETTEKYSQEKLEVQVRGFHTWHTTVGGSAYNLGEVEYTPVGVASKVPAALNVTYFRPYVWEARNPVVAIGALESLVFFVVFLIVLFQHRTKIIKRIKEVPMLFAMFVYCLVFGFAVGFTSYNFGALARYKIPVMSLFAFILIYLYYYKQPKNPDKIESSE